MKASICKLGRHKKQHCERFRTTRGSEGERSWAIKPQSGSPDGGSILVPEPVAKTRSHVQVCGAQRHSNPIV